MQTTEQNAIVTDALPPRLQTALRRGALERLPLTFLPFVNQQLHQWPFLFPHERGSVERLLTFIAQLDEHASRSLFSDVVAIETRMGVQSWQFSATEQTIQNSSLLARSPYFQEWRRAVQAVFDAADRGAGSTADALAAHRLVLIDLPDPLPLNRATVWHRWQGIGTIVPIDADPANPTSMALEPILSALPARSATEPANSWLIDAGPGLVNAAAHRSFPGIHLSYARLDRYRQNFSHQMNTMRKDLADADAVFDRLRSVDVSPWCPPEVSADPAVREFVRSLYLSGNGAVIFANSFVQWAAAEAFRRARPTLLAARFGVRSKPKPFTGVAVFDNPDQVNPLPAEDDLPGSALDAEMLALYIWLAAARYDEYQRNTVCICFAAAIREAYVIAPPEFTLASATGPISMERFGRALAEWLV